MCCVSYTDLISYFLSISEESIHLPVLIFRQDSQMAFEEGEESGMSVVTSKVFGCK
jgi:hypothetical protein